MNRLPGIKAVVLVIAALAVFGCKSKQEAPATGAAPAQPEAVKSIQGKTAAGILVASPKDKSEAEAAATRVLGQMEAGQFAAIYKEASPAFKEIGKEADFVAKFSQTRQKTGSFGPAQQTSFVTRPDQAHVLIYRVENDRFKTERRLSFARSKDGKMELLGLNQHDEPKQSAAK